MAPPLDFSLTSNPHGLSFDIDIPIKDTDPTLGLDLIVEDDTDRVRLRSYKPSTLVARIPRWRSTLRNSILVAIGDTIINTITDATREISKSRVLKKPSINVVLLPTEHINLRLDTSVPQMRFD